MKDAEKVFPTFDSKRLNEWQRKGYIKKLINKWYSFTEIPESELLQFRISNNILQPSYVSLESALSYYQFIPEGVYTTEAISTVKTVHYSTSAGSFNYHCIKPKYFFGYTLAKLDQVPVLIAEPEKAILDYLYLNSMLKKPEDFEAMRFNADAIAERVDWEKLALYTELFDSPTLNKRIRLFKKNQLHVSA